MVPIKTLRNYFCILATFSLFLSPIVFTKESTISSEFIQSLQQFVQKKDPALTITSITQKSKTLRIHSNGALKKYQNDLQFMEQLQDLVDTQSQILVPKPDSFEFLVDSKPLFPYQKSVSGSKFFSNQKQSSVVLNPAHGSYFNTKTNQWEFQRSVNNGIQEDLINIDLSRKVDQNLESSDLELYSTRDLDNSLGNHPNNQLWSEMGSMEYLKQKGLPAKIWDDPGTPTAENPNLNKDLRSRPLYANFLKADFLINIHHNAGGGCGTETWYDTTNASRYHSRRLAQNIQSKLIQNLRKDWKESWCDRGVKSSNGGYAENRLSNIPSVIVEVGFMDSTESEDLKNPKFQEIVSRSISESIQDFANTQLFEAESLTGAGENQVDPGASNGQIRHCNFCQGVVSQGSMIIDPAKQNQFRLTYHVKATNLPPSSENPVILSLKAGNYGKNPEKIVTKDLTASDLESARDSDQDGFKELEITLPITGGPQIYFQLITNGKAQFSTDVITVTDVSQALPCTPFPDVPADYPAASHICNLKQAGVINGYPDGNFYPEEVVSRGQMAKFVKNGLFGPDFTQTNCAPFKDLKPTEVFYTEIMTLKCKGVVSGFSDNTYRASNAVNRGQTMKFAINGARIAKNDPNLFSKSHGEDFRDVPANHPFYQFIKSGYTADIIYFNNGLFWPEEPTTRGFMSQVIDKTRQSSL